MNKRTTCSLCGIWEATCEKCGVVSPTDAIDTFFVPVGPNKDRRRDEFKINVCAKCQEKYSTY